MTTWACRMGWASLVAVVAVGCANYDDASFDGAKFPSQEELFDTPEAPDVLIVRAGGHFLTVKVSDHDLFGPDVQLSVYGGDDSPAALRGRLWNRLVDLDLGPTTAHGTVGGTPFDLTARRDGGVLHAEGTIEAKDIAFDLGPRGLTGRLGTCRYDLRPAKEARGSARGPRTYEGARACGGAPVITTLRIPAELASWPAPAAAAAVGLLLSSSD